MNLADVMQVYIGSDGAATRDMYQRLLNYGQLGVIATNLFRAQKCSERAKGYRGGYRANAYERKQWSMNNLADVLRTHATDCGITWGWGQDDKQVFHKVVLYVDLPTGQVSFHTELRGQGPDYRGEWDGKAGASPGRICRFVASVFATVRADPTLALPLEG